MYLGFWAAGSAAIGAIQKISPMLVAASTLGVNAFQRVSVFDVK